MSGEAREGGDNGFVGLIDAAVALSWLLFALSMLLFVSLPVVVAFVRSLVQGAHKE